jgi:hypothetical protein
MRSSISCVCCKQLSCPQNYLGGWFDARLDEVKQGSLLEGGMRFKVFENYPGDVDNPHPTTWLPLVFYGPQPYPYQTPQARLRLACSGGEHRERQVACSQHGRRWGSCSRSRAAWQFMRRDGYTRPLSAGDDSRRGALADARGRRLRGGPADRGAPDRGRPQRGGRRRGLLARRRAPHRRPGTQGAMPLTACAIFGR